MQSPKEDRRDAAIADIDWIIEKLEREIATLKTRRNLIEIYDNFEVDDNDGARVMSDYDQALILAELDILTNDDQKHEVWGINGIPSSEAKRNLFMHADNIKSVYDKYGFMLPPWFTDKYKRFFSSWSYVPIKTSDLKSEVSVIPPNEKTTISQNVDTIIGILRRNGTPERTGFAVRFHSDGEFRCREETGAMLNFLGAFTASAKRNLYEFVISTYLDSPLFNITYAYIESGDPIKKCDIDEDRFQIFLTDVLSSGVADVYNCYDRKWDEDSEEYSSEG